MQPQNSRILLVDDEPSVLLTVQAILKQEGYEVEPAASGEEAIRLIRERQFDVVLTDLKMKGTDGLGVLAEVRKRSPNTVTLMMTGYGSVDSALEALQLGAYEYLLKPVEVSELKLAVKRSLERKRLSEIDTLYRVGRSISHAPGLPAIEQEIVAATREVLGLRNAYLLTLDRDAKPVGLQEGLARIFEREAVMTRLSSSENVVFEQDDAGVAAGEPRSVALVPGIANERLVCILAADNGAEPYDFHAGVQRFLQALAEKAALAVANAKLISELQRKNESLEQANAKLKELDILKSQFLSVATHELRTPLSIILGYNSMLAESLENRLSKEENETLKESVAACKRLIRLVNSMLDITQIERGKMHMNFSLGDLRHSVHSVVTLFQAEAKAKNLRLNLVLPSRLQKFQFDAERIEQVLINLLGNAMKFTEPGGTISVTVRYLASEEAVQVSVSDSGVGISSDEQAIIFDEFAQIRRHTAKRQKEGSGLGLAIAKRIVEAHQGAISVTSVPESGSTFAFTLPLKQRSTSAISA